MVIQAHLVIRAKRVGPYPVQSAIDLARGQAGTVSCIRHKL